MVRPLDSGLSELPTNQEVQDSILEPAVGFFPSIEIFHSMFGIIVLVFESPPSMPCLVLSSEEALQFTDHRSGRPSNRVMIS